MELNYEKMVTFCAQVTEMVEGRREGVIVGVKLDIRSDDLRVMLERRSAFHGARAEFWEDHARTTRGKIDRSDRLVTGDPVDDSLNRAKGHRDSEARFAFLAANLIEGKTYRLSDQDVRSHELDKREE